MSKPVTEEQCGTYRQQCAEGRKVHIALRLLPAGLVSACIVLAIASLTASMGASTTSRDSADKAAEKAGEASDAAKDVRTQLNSHARLQPQETTDIKETLERFEVSQKASDTRHEAGLRRIEDRLEKLHAPP